MNSPASDNRLFVYGTLRHGCRSAAHDWLLRWADPLGPAWTPGRLYRIAHYPGLVLSDDPAERVIGELYALRQPETVLAELDRYEECGPGFPEPTEYVRCQRPVTLLDGSRCSAWVYLYNRSVAKAKRIVCGDFLARD